jgi:hypothetical protein
VVGRVDAEVKSTASSANSRRLHPDARRTIIGLQPAGVSVASTCVQPLEEDAAGIIVYRAVLPELVPKLVKPGSEILPAREVELVEEAAAPVHGAGSLPERTACAGADLGSTETLLDPARPWFETRNHRHECAARFGCRHPDSGAA